jgi:hypothetical protein
MGMDVYGKQPSKASGEYFRANIWSWRPLHQQMAVLCSDLLSEELLRSMFYNDGAGPDDQETCTEMANRFEKALVKFPNGFAIESDLRVNEDDRFIREEELARDPELKTRSAYRIDREHVLEWIEFLRHSGGFAVN